MGKGKIPIQSEEDASLRKRKKFSDTKEAADMKKAGKEIAILSGAKTLKQLIQNSEADDILSVSSRHEHSDQKYPLKAAFKCKLKYELIPELDEDIHAHCNTNTNTVSAAAEKIASIPELSSTPVAPLQDPSVTPQEQLDYDLKWFRKELHSRSQRFETELESAIAQEIKRLRSLEDVDRSFSIWDSKV